MALSPCLGCGRLATLRKGRCGACQLRRPRGNAWEPTRQRVLDRDGHLCRGCGAPAHVVDHITPIASGGTDDHSNLQALCAACNGTKGARLD